MKKTILIFTAIAFSATVAVAQEAKPTIFSAGINAGLPTESPSLYSIGFGVDVQADFPVTSAIRITGSIGYENLATQSKYSDLGFDKSTGIIPVLLGGKILIGEQHKIYGHAQIGYGFATQKGADGAFAYAPSLGYYFSPNWDVSVKYLAFKTKGTTAIGILGVRLAYSF